MIVEGSIVSTVNLTEVIGRFVRDGHDAQGVGRSRVSSARVGPQPSGPHDGPRPVRIGCRSGCSGHPLNLHASVVETIVKRKPNVKDEVEDGATVAVGVAVGVGVAPCASCVSRAVCS